MSAGVLRKFLFMYFFLPHYEMFSIKNHYPLRSFIDQKFARGR